MADVGPEGALYVGSPETVAQKIVANLRTLDASRFDLKFGIPGLTQETVMTNVELYGSKVIPRVRDYGPKADNVVARVGSTPSSPSNRAGNGFCFSTTPQIAAEVNALLS